LELSDLRDHLWELLEHYESVLAAHNLPLPFNRSPRP
jgi:hypothetical protein